MEEVTTTILCDRHCHLGEGPTYDAATNTAWWVDILERGDRKSTRLNSSHSAKSRMPSSA